MFDPVGSANPPKPPKPPPGPAPGGDQETDIDVREKPKSHVPRRYKVIFHNDDYTTMEFVVEVLCAFSTRARPRRRTSCSPCTRKGTAVAGIYTRDVAETKVAEVMKHARESGMPLLVTTEPE